MWGMIEYSERNKEIERQVYRDNNKRQVIYKQGERIKEKQRNKERNKKAGRVRER